MEQLAPIYYCQEPEKWPEPPSVMSFTTLMDIEKCPRCWALLNAEYPHIWDKRGYPNRPTVPALIGSTIHRGIEIIIKDLIAMQCRSIDDTRLVQILKRHGGWSAVLTKVLDDVLLEEKHNPRVSHEYGSLRSRIRSQIPKMREATQNILRRVDWACRANGTYERQTAGALGLGSHSEVYLECREIGLCGRADLITLTEGGCSITDFKTGAHKAQHELQVQIYAFLWVRDEHRNPLRRMANRLCLSYEAKDICLPGPSEDDLSELESQLHDRISRAKRATTTEKPRARLSLENCRYCPVRHLCDEYWTEWGQNNLYGECAEDALVDVEVVLEKHHTSNIWNAILHAGLPLHGGERILVRIDSHWDFIEYCRATKQKIRMLACRTVSIAAEQEGAHGVDYLHNPYEVFVVPS